MSSASFVHTNTDGWHRDGVHIRDHLGRSKVMCTNEIDAGIVMSCINIARMAIEDDDKAIRENEVKATQEPQTPPPAAKDGF